MFVKFGGMYTILAYFKEFFDGMYFSLMFLLLTASHAPGAGTPIPNGYATGYD